LLGFVQIYFFVIHIRKELLREMRTFSESGIF